jgi:hypothetical protein
MKSLIGLSRALVKDLMRLHPEVRGLDRDLLTIEARIKSEGVGFLSVALPSFGKAFDQSIASGKMANIMGFAYNGQIPKFLSGIVCHIFDTTTGVLKEDAPAEYILSVRQLCYFFKKFLPSEERDVYLAKQAVKDFNDVESAIGEVNPSLLARFSHICSFVLPELDLVQEHEARHGPGAVFEGYTSNQKWSEVYRRLLEFDDKLISIGYDLPASLLVERLDGEQLPKSDPVGTCARLVTVPKSCSALRTITVEPCLNQFVQQGLNSTLRDHIKKCKVLRHSLTLDSQKPNQELAIEGSQVGNWCTIDLSSASDLLSLEVVKACFANRPRFLEALLASRTPRVDDGCKTITLKKYAGMGNATTFPVQSIVFAMIAITSIVSSSERVNYRTLIRAANDVRVFGDDIIIRTEHFQAFADWITSFGLKINQGKTFSVGNFRESCGVDAYKGIDVTPVYLRHDPDNSSTDPSTLASIVSTSNQLWLRCYYECSEFLRKQVSKTHVLPLVPFESQGLGWHTRQNVRTYQRWSSTLHRFEVQTYVPCGSRRKDRLDGYPALIKYFHHPLIGRDDPTHLSVSVRRFNLKLRKRWVQA